MSLTEEEKAMLESLLRKGKSAARKQTRARILLKATAGSKDTEIMEALAISVTQGLLEERKPVGCDGVPDAQGEVDHGFL
ncbi:MAG: hypothetical protein LBB76_05730 [Azoarcus sp.]|nr:hypothetical protein [Azoarcus sp.]